MLTVRETMILDFEGRWWKYQAVKETTARDLFGVGATSYYAELNALLSRPEALAYAPLTVKRLRRLRDQRRAQRSTQRLSIGERPL